MVGPVSHRIKTVRLLWYQGDVMSDRAVARHHPDADQRALVASFDRPLDALLPLARLHDGSSDGAATWAGLAELGLFGIALGEDAGGVGLGAAEEVLLAERLGRRLATPAVFATMAAAHAGGAAVAEIAAGSAGSRLPIGAAGASSRSTARVPTSS